MSQPRQLDDLSESWLGSYIPCSSVSSVSEQKGVWKEAVKASTWKHEETKVDQSELIHHRKRSEGKLETQIPTKLAAIILTRTHHDDGFTSPEVHPRPVQRHQRCSGPLESEGR